MYVKLSWRPEVDGKLSHNGCTAGNFDLHTCESTMELILDVTSDLLHGGPEIKTRHME